MGKEIEFKFIVDRIPEGLDSYYIRQTYIDGFKKFDILREIFKDVNLSFIDVFRCRLIKEKNELISYVVTLKTKGQFIRDEYEKVVTKEIYEKLIDDNVLSFIEKNRYVTKIDDFTFEFDEFLNLNEKLLLCEVEIDNQNDDTYDDLRKILVNKLNINFKDVTYDPRFKNNNISKYFANK